MESQIYMLISGGEFFCYIVFKLKNKNLDIPSTIKNEFDKAMSEDENFIDNFEKRVKDIKGISNVQFIYDEIKYIG